MPFSGASMSDEPEARMWDEPGPSYERRSYLQSAFASSEHLDRAPLLSEEIYSEVTVGAPAESTEDHCHWKGRNTPPSAVPQLIAALVLCFFFMICELVGGYLAGSLSVMSDAAHMLSDCAGFALALLAFRWAEHRPDQMKTYGYKRAEVLGAMCSVLIIWMLTAIFVYIAASRLVTGDLDIQPDMMMLVSGAGVGFNIVLALVLHGCAKDIAHHHTHGGAPCQHDTHTHALTTHADTPTRFRWFRRKHNASVNVNGDVSLKDLTRDTHVVTNNARNINLRAALIHVIGDLIQSCGVLLASILIKFYPSAQVVDPICTFIFSVLVLLTSARVVRDALNMLMQGVPRGFRYRECLISLSTVAGVRHVHSLHVWPLSTHHTVLTAHIAVDDPRDAESVLHACQGIAKEYSVQSATFQVERFNPVMQACDECHQPGATM